eukprot:scaffold15759_cov112-Isochrysis_galbana.AAC.5
MLLGTSSVSAGRCAELVCPSQRPNLDLLTSTPSGAPFVSGFGRFLGKQQGSVEVSSEAPAVSSESRGTAQTGPPLAGCRQGRGCRPSWLSARCRRRILKGGWRRRRRPRGVCGSVAAQACGRRVHLAAGQQGQGWPAAADWTHSAIAGRRGDRVGCTGQLRRAACWLRACRAEATLSWVPLPVPVLPRCPPLVPLPHHCLSVCECAGSASSVSAYLRGAALLCSTCRMCAAPLCLGSISAVCRRSGRGTAAIARQHVTVSRSCS